MATLYIENISAPDEIKRALVELSKRIKFEREDGKAANGYVFFGVNRVTGVPVTLKFYYWGGRPEYHAEPKQLSEIDAQNVIKILDAGLVDAKWAYFLTQTCVQGDLDEALSSKPFGTKQALECVYQVLSGLGHLHARRFLHRDIKPANIYLTAGEVAIIGDFGSVKRLPDNQGEIPASGHSLIYRPPESIVSNSYGIPGDIYQCGVLLYQLLGGALPYDGLAWLNRRQLAQYDSLPSQSEQVSYVDLCIKTKIVAGKAIDLTSIPSWVPDSVRKLISKACKINPSARFQSVSAFMAKIHDIRDQVLDWQVVDGIPTVFGGRSYRVMAEEVDLFVEKRVGANWRRDNSFTESTLDDLVRAISDRLR